MRLSTNLLLIATNLVLATNCFASHIACYSGGRTIYEGNAKEFFFDDGALIVHDIRTNRDVVIMAACVIKL